MLESGRGAGDKAERGAAGPGAPWGTRGVLCTPAGLGAAGAPLSLTPVTVGQGRGGIGGATGGKGGLREVCRGQAAGEGGLREQQIEGGEEGNRARREGICRGWGGQSQEPGSERPPLCHLLPAPHVAATPVLLSAPARPSALTVALSPLRNAGLSRGWEGREGGGAQCKDLK